MSVSDRRGDRVVEIPKVENELKILEVTRSRKIRGRLRVVFQADDSVHECCVTRSMLRSFSMFQKAAYLHCRVEVNSAYDWINRTAANTAFRREIVEAMRKGGVR